ncbi:putative PAS/PAC sensor protein [Alicyclobacillus hesperidum URH17-3-68]|uniref:Uncharacterized protein n=1 Tax=Alicyclobacillus hesperidum TaxID=89784 RepID=A0A1H2Y8I2_9BACL|nr:hypothetical protein [Alicyclobacillus hesperidum]EJY54748.1 putative PAS/PAC sensor protein [Alicyclobacillus hesperidum URH17-3-68]SDX00869.1 hypothetical protein SAMN04489725_12917 [Alicyclobacillus hesperidum]
MNRKYKETLKYPQKEFDLLKEGTIGIGVTAVLVIGAAAVFGAPYRPAVTNQQVANTEPIVVMQTALGDLDGQGEMSTYGPPYNNGTGSTQSLFGFHPETWWGTPYQLNTAKDDVLTPLSMLAKASNNTALSDALKQYENAPAATQQKWDQNLTNALNKAIVEKNGQVGIPAGNYGPVREMMNSELSLASSGLLSGALDRETNQGVYRWNDQNDLLFLQGSALHKIAGTLNMKGEQWGINHDEAAYPGPWWLTPYTFLYQIPPYSTSSAGDEMAAYTMALLFLILVFVPFIPGLNKLPKILPLYKWIWRDWYKSQGQQNGFNRGRSHSPSHSHS